MIPVSIEGVCCLDFEASGLGDRGYPIEMAVIDCIRWPAGAGSFGHRRGGYRKGSGR
jgi:hypothetical protein